MEEGGGMIGPSLLVVVAAKTTSSHSPLMIWYSLADWTTLRCFLADDDDDDDGLCLEMDSLPAAHRKGVRQRRHRQRQRESAGHC